MIFLKILLLTGETKNLKGMVVMLSFVVFSLQAQNLGVWGETFEIAEEDLLEQISSKLQILQKKGKLEQLTKEASGRIKDMILKPSQVQGVSYTEIRRKYVFDPSIVVTKDLFDNEGRIFARKGEKFNPLNNVTMRPLIFIDGENKNHIKWAIAKLSDPKIYRHEQGKIVLIKGSPLALQETLKREIYFDQFGLICRKLKIKHVPAIVYQNPNEKFLTVVEDLP